MSNLKFLKESSLNRLQANITANLSHYQKNRLGLTSISPAQTIASTPLCRGRRP